MRGQLGDVVSPPITVNLQTSSQNFWEFGYLKIHSFFKVEEKSGLQEADDGIEKFT